MMRASKVSCPKLSRPAQVCFPLFPRSLTLAKIVRGIATGNVRRYCEERERLIQVGLGHKLWVPLMTVTMTYTELLGNLPASSLDLCPTWQRV